MPHAELKYSNDLTFDAKAALLGIERVIQDHDAGSGECKGRAYPARDFHHTHCLLEVSMLTKSHRTPAFTQTLLADLKAELQRHLNVQCFVSLGIKYSDENYITTEHVPFV